MSMSVGGATNAWGGATSTGASMRMSPQQKYSNVFDQIDTAGTGSISKTQFEQAFSSLKMPPSFRQAGADAVFSQLDTSGTGSVSKQDFVSGMIDQMKAMRAARSQSGDKDGDSDFGSLLSALGTTAGTSAASTTSSATAEGTGGALDVTV